MRQKSGCNKTLYCHVDVSQTLLSEVSTGERNMVMLKFRGVCTLRLLAKGPLSVASVREKDRGRRSESLVSRHPEPSPSAGREGYLTPALCKSKSTRARNFKRAA